MFVPFNWRRILFDFAIDTLNTVAESDKEKLRSRILLNKHRPDNASLRQRTEHDPRRLFSTLESDVAE